MKSCPGSPHKVIFINRAPNVGLLPIIKLDAVRVALIPLAQDLATLPSASINLGFYLVAHLETKLSHFARLFAGAG